MIATMYYCIIGSIMYYCIIGSIYIAIDQTPRDWQTIYPSISNYKWMHYGLMEMQPIGFDVFFKM